MGDFPNPRAGETWSQQSAQQFRALSEEVRRLKGLITGHGFNVPSGALPREAHTILPLIPRDRTVVLTKKPTIGDTTLEVREARYVDVPPKACTGGGPEVQCYYMWYGDPFEVYPPLGMQVMDYAGDEQVPSDDANPPKLDSVFHRCHREHDYWVMDLQVGPIHLAIVRETYNLDPDTKKIGIQEVEILNNGNVRLREGVKYVKAWPGLLSKNYAAFRWIGPAVVGDMLLPAVPVLAVVNIGGVSYVEQFSGLRYQLHERPTGVRKTDCIATEAKF